MIAMNLYATLRGAQWVPLLLALILLPRPITTVAGDPPQPTSGRSLTLLRNSRVEIAIDPAGGSIASFKLLSGRSSGLNPLQWNTPSGTDSGATGYGHFLCLDRWGPASEPEAARGMPYHGEATHVLWTNTLTANHNSGSLAADSAELRAYLPKAGLSVHRSVTVGKAATVAKVIEEVRNVKDLGRPLNMVQHPTIAPPFLDEATLVDCNGVKGFAQGGQLPNPEEKSTLWPNALVKDGTMSDLRHLTTNPEPNVVSYSIDNPIGWITATCAKKGLLIGYIWKTSDYPWVSHWRDVSKGKPAARGLEFGTTGLHQPFPILLEKGKIWGKPLFAYLDAGESLRKGYMIFLAEVPEDFNGVAALELNPESITLIEHKTGGSSRTITVSTGGLAL